MRGSERFTGRGPLDREEHFSSHVVRVPQRHPGLDHVPAELSGARWYRLWHHEGRRARHGASMMAPDYTHWHGMYEVADRFYTKLLPEAHELTRHAAESGKKEQAGRVEQVIADILARPEHVWIQPPLPPASAPPGAPPAPPGPPPTK